MPTASALSEIAPVLALRPFARAGLGRREFLKRCGCVAAAYGLASGFGRFGSVSALAQSIGDYKALVCVFLFGGNDSNNMIVPMDPQGYSLYKTARGSLAIPQSSLLPIASDFGLHPGLAGLPQLFSAGRLAILANVGTLTVPTTRASFVADAASLPENLFSHIDQENQWQSCFAASNVPSGWGGRIADSLASGGGATFPTVISVAGETLFCQGQTTSPLCFSQSGPPAFSGVSGDPESVERFAVMQQLLTLSSGATLVQAASDQLQQTFRESSELGQALASAAPLATVFPQSSFGQQLQQIAKLIQIRSALGATRQIFFAILGGFDTHLFQLPIQATLMNQLGAALSAFYNATVELGVQNSVTTFTLSDFSRTLTPNSTGTDHGWGGHHLVLGGAVRGGSMYGAFPELVPGGPDDSTDNGRWVPTTSVDQYAATLASWFGVSPGSLSAIAPNLGNFSVQNLGFV